jgi:hypothetical protein
VTNTTKRRRQLIRPSLSTILLAGLGALLLGFLLVLLTSG